VKIKVKTLTKEHFARWGQFIASNDTTGLTRLSIANYMGNLAVAELGNQLSISLLNPFNRELTLKFMEQHKKTHEICVAIREDCIITVAPDLNGVPNLDGIEAFFLKESDTVVYAPGIWHWVPFTVGTGEAKQLIIYKDQTGVYDFLKIELPQSIELEV
jgi:ureidoglycolate hydrolase